MAKSGSGFPDNFHFTLVGDDIGRNLMVALITSLIYSFCQGGQRAAGNMIPTIPLSLILPHFFD